MAGVTGPYSDEALERVARDAVSLDETHRLLDRFATLTRESGTADERAAADYLVDRLNALGIPVTGAIEPELYRACRGVPTSDCPTIDPIASRTPAFSRSTDGAEVTGDLVHVPRSDAAGMSSFYETSASALGADGDVGSRRRQNRHHGGFFYARSCARLRATRRDW